MAKWIGYAVSVNCGEPLGCYQGTILEADGSTITLTKAFRNGFPYPKSQVTLNAADIKDLKIIESKPEPSEQTHSTVAVTKGNKKGQKATVCENLQAYPTNSGTSSNQPPVNPSNNSKGTTSRGPGPGAGPSGSLARSKPIDIQAGRVNKNNNQAGNGGGSYGASGSTPKGRGAGGGGGGGGGGGAGGDRARRRNEACFGSAAEIALDDFDFEGNLALFDKRALWASMPAHAKPDVVRQADAALRHDQNVLGAPPARRPPPPRLPPRLRGARLYVSDDGTPLPSVLPALRRRLLDALDRLGLGECTRTLLARAACDVVLRLVGGGRRLDARNAHQAPVVVALVGPHGGGAAGARCVRLLRAHGARAALHVAGPGAGAGAGAGAAGGGPLDAELAALAVDGVRPEPLERLPEPDLVLLALYDLQQDDPQEQYTAALRWAGAVRGGRAPCVALEPPGAGWPAGGPRCRAAVLAALPAALPAQLGRLYLANVGAPPALLRDQGVHYRPPFGAASLLALHPDDDEDAADMTDVTDIADDDHLVEL